MKTFSKTPYPNGWTSLTDGRALHRNNASHKDSHSLFYSLTTKRRFGIKDNSWIIVIYNMSVTSGCACSQWRLLNNIFSGWFSFFEFPGVHLIRSVLMKSFHFVRNIPPKMTVCFFSEGFLMTSCCETLNLSRCAVPPRKRAVDLILTSRKKVNSSWGRFLKKTRTHFCGLFVNVILIRFWCNQSCYSLKKYKHCRLEEWFSFPEMTLPLLICIWRDGI